MEPARSSTGPIADDGAIDLTPEMLILRERARWLAEEGADDDSLVAQGKNEVLLCRLHDERYAIDLAVLRAVQLARGLTPIPCTPPFVAGMLNVRGTVVSVLDLARILELGDAPPPDEPLALLVDCPAGTAQGQVGLLVHEVLGATHLPLGDLDRAFSGNPAVRGIAGDGIIILDLHALLADRRIEVADEWA